MAAARAATSQDTEEYVLLLLDDGMAVGEGAVGGCIALLAGAREVDPRRPRSSGAGETGLEG
jgi:hypothetical protein